MSKYLQLRLPSLYLHDSILLIAQFESHISSVQYRDYFWSDRRFANAQKPACFDGTSRSTTFEHHDLFSIGEDYEVSIMRCKGILGRSLRLSQPHRTEAHEFE